MMRRPIMQIDNLTVAQAGVAVPWMNIVNENKRRGTVFSLRLFRVKHRRIYFNEGSQSPHTHTHTHTHTHIYIYITIL
jgi:hypothetical protein